MSTDPLKLTVTWTNPKQRKSKKELIRHYVENSEIFVNVRMNGDVPEALYLEFHGELSRIPSLKNKKIPGKNFTNPEVEARLIAMSILYNDELERQGINGALGWSELVHVTLIAGYRGRSFDLIGCMESIQDWLEPATKPVGRVKRPRGWGVGVIADDKQVIPHMLHSHLTQIKHEHTTVIVRPWESVKEHAMNYLCYVQL